MARAESKVYESVKRLTALGLATAERQRTGRRYRTVYSITPAGRRALREWLRQPGTGPAQEFTAAIKLFYADQGDQQDALATLAAVTEWAQRMLAFGAGLGQQFLDTDGGPFPERLHINTLINELLLRHAAMVADWAAWATQQVGDWNGTGPQPHRHDADLDSYRKGAALATTRRPACPSPASPGQTLAPGSATRAQYAATPNRERCWRCVPGEGPGSWHRLPVAPGTLREGSCMGREAIAE